MYQAHAALAAAAAPLRTAKKADRLEPGAPSRPNGPGQAKPTSYDCRPLLQRSSSRLTVSRAQCPLPHGGCGDGRSLSRDDGTEDERGDRTPRQHTRPARGRRLVAGGPSCPSATEPALREEAQLIA
ncbi:hypothetical protein ACCO45_005819 [Purpureocillium lilacinum]|uniref:Uncharacterized protein n=1 Tax=Purpureocillium lilacinum TaxID=33203 RepID=A0ACC4DXB6_PURLI